jgi:homoaconitase/3-isopropylmalate dehydratase large subunit
MPSPVELAVQVLAAVMLTGKIWLKVPQSIQVILHGQRLQPGVSAKDIALEVVKQLTISGATYQSVEYHWDHRCTT